MKTMSYVQAVKMAVAKAEQLGIDFYYDKWIMFMIHRPRLSSYREI